MNKHPASVHTYTVLEHPMTWHDWHDSDFTIRPGVELSMKGTHVCSILRIPWNIATKFIGPIVMRILASPAKVAAHDESMGLV